MRISLIFALCLPGLAFAEDVPAEKLQKATGLAQIMARAETCKYALDAKKTRAYYVAEGLATPQVLDYISMKVAQESGWAAQTTETECALTHATAEALGILK
ncbi:MAG: hypothetical protein LCH99_35985 [Proteobacteria bacterium]|nr:hypothetical protein [Pseudomonadota bacterium]